MKKCLKVLEVVAVLQHGGHIIWSQPRVPGSSSYMVFLPGGRNPDRCIGRITESMASTLWSAGFLTPEGSQRTDKSGRVLIRLVLDKGSLSFLSSSDQEVSGNE